MNEKIELYSTIFLKKNKEKQEKEEDEKNPKIIEVVQWLAMYIYRRDSLHIFAESKGFLTIFF